MLVLTSKSKVVLPDSSVIFFYYLRPSNLIGLTQIQWLEVVNRVEKLHEKNPHNFRLDVESWRKWNDMATFVVEAYAAKGTSVSSDIIEPVTDLHVLEEMTNVFYEKQIEYERWKLEAQTLIADHYIKDYFKKNQ